MRKPILLVCVALAGVGCKKSGGTGGGGGGGWLVGSTALMANVQGDGAMGKGYDLGGSMQLNGIACRYQGEAWVVGEEGTLLYTYDGGKSWASQWVAPGSLRAVATQDDGPVYVAADSGLYVTNDTGATWTRAGAGTAFRAVAAAQEGTAVLALADDGGLYAYDRKTGALERRGTFDGAHAIGLSPDGQTAIIAGHGLARSSDGGEQFTVLAVDPAQTFDDVRLAEDGRAVAVGAAGAIASVEANGDVALQHVGTANLHALHIADVDDDDALGYAAGDGGQVLITHDAGATWALGPNVGRTVLGIDEIGAYHR